MESHCDTIHQAAVNLVLTNKCNKKCDYCFATGKNDPVVEMSLDMIQKVIDMSPETKIKLLGGEPTQHSQFCEIVDLLVDNGVDFIIISNMLFDMTVVNKLIEASESVKVGILANATDLDRMERTRIWVRNYNKLLPHMDAISCGFTYQMHVDYDAYFDYLLNLIEVRHVRLSINFPVECGDAYPIVGDWTVGRVFMDITKKLYARDIDVSMDCVMFPCLMPQLPLAMITGYKSLGVPQFKSKCNCGSIDIFQDGSVSWCYPTKTRVRVSNIFEYTNLTECVDVLKGKYKESMARYQIPNVCIECDYYGTICDGPCMAFMR